MNPYEAEAWVDGYDAHLQHQTRLSNPYPRPYASPWDKDRHWAWDRGWLASAQGKPFRDPRIGRPEIQIRRKVAS